MCMHQKAAWWFSPSIFKRADYLWKKDNSLPEQYTQTGIVFTHTEIVNSIH